MENILPWYFLKSVPGIGNHTFKRLINRFNSPEIAITASREDLLKVDGITPRLVKAIKQHQLPEYVEKDLDLVRQKGYKIITMSDEDYPPLLLQIADPPPVLYVFGHLGASIKNIAVVGSRNSTNYGILTTKSLCENLALCDVTIVSGMALGIDSAAHQGALMARGHTVAVLGSGLENIYPPENKKLFYKIAENGAVVSELPLMTEPEPHNFPKRNRIISGMSLGTVVVEASRRSGALITARLALEQNREVFAVPGSIQSFKSTGTHTLIKQGAKLVEHPQDILEEFSHMTDMTQAPIGDENTTGSEAGENLPPLSSEEILVFEALEPYPIHIDDLVRMLKMKPGKIASILLQLELKGIVKHSPGKLFSVTPRD